MYVINENYDYVIIIFKHLLNLLILLSEFFYRIICYIDYYYAFYN